MAASGLNFAIQILALAKLRQEFAAGSLGGNEITCCGLGIRNLLIGGSLLDRLPSADDSLPVVASLRISPRGQVIGRSFPDIRVHGVQIFEILDVHKIIWQMALSFAA